MYTLLRLAGTLRAWQSRYCAAEFRDCARYHASRDGRRPPVNLMPNGARLRTYEAQAALEAAAAEAERE